MTQKSGESNEFLECYEKNELGKVGYKVKDGQFLPGWRVECWAPHHPPHPGVLGWHPLLCPQPRSGRSAEADPAARWAEAKGREARPASATVSARVSWGQSQLVSSRCEGRKQTNPQLSSGPGGSIAVDVTLGACELPVCAAKASTPPSSGFISGEVNEDQSLRTGQPYSDTRVSSYLDGEMRMEWCNIGVTMFGILFLNAVLTRF